MEREIAISPPYGRLGFGQGCIAGEPNPDPEGIDGLLTVDDVPGVRQISYFEEKTNRLIAQNWSNPDGTYRLDYVSPDIEIMIVAKDWSRTWAHVIQGGVRPSTVPLVINAGTWTVPIGVPFAGVVRVLYGAGETATTITGTLPEGLVANDGHISGAWPTGIVGQYPLAVEVVDSQMQVRTAEIVLDLVLLPVKLTASPAVPTALAVDEAMTPITFVASGGEGPYTYSVSAGSLPSGTSFDPVTGVWSGTPDTEDEYSFTIKATGVRGSAESQYTVDVETPAVPYRYYRINVTANNGGGSYMAIAEIELRLSVGGADITTPAAANAGGAATASSMANSSNAPYMAFDDNTTDKWTANGTAGWLEYDCGTLTAVKEVGIMGQYAQGDQASFAPKDFTIEARQTTGDSWTVLRTVAGETSWGAAEMRSFAL